MTPDEVRQYCLSLPLATEDMVFGDDYINFRILDKIFTCLNLIHGPSIALKCDPDYAIDLRDRYTEIEPAWHWDKKHWNQIECGSSLPSDFIRSLIRHSYSEVVKKLPRRTLAGHPEITEIQ